MYKLINRGILTVTGLFFCSLCLGAFANNELLLPMPGQKTINKAQKNQKNKPQKTAKPSPQNTNDQNSAILPLPTHIKHKKTAKTADKTNTQANENKPNDSPIIEIAIPKAASAGAEQETAPQQCTSGTELPQANENIPVPPDEVVVNADKTLDEIIPKPNSAEPPASVSTNGEAYPIFPKDTSSAIFMVMKSWQCQDYSFGSLLKQAVETYGTEAGDSFVIQGLDGVESELLVTVEEEDITLDELLDVIGQKVGRDWGVDIPSKIIYFYPPGISADSYSAW